MPGDAAEGMVCACPSASLLRRDGSLERHRHHDRSGRLPEDLGPSSGSGTASHPRPGARLVSELEVDELAAAELARRARRRRSRPCRRRSGRTRGSARSRRGPCVTYWTTWYDQERKDDQRDRQQVGRRRDRRTVDDRLEHAADLRHRLAPGRAASRSRPCGTSPRSARAFQQARSIGSVGWIRSSQGRSSRCPTRIDPLIGAPEHERPGRAVPEPADDHRQHQVAVELQHVPPRLPPERDVEVVAEPGREADVPARPEVLRAGGEVGEVEVQGQLEARGTWRSRGPRRCSPRSRSRSGTRRRRSPASPGRRRSSATGRTGR